MRRQDDYYESYRGRKKKRGAADRKGRSAPPRRGGCLVRLIRRLLFHLFVLALIAMCALYVLPARLFVPSGDTMGAVSGLPISPVNVLILGVDAMDAGAQRSDAMMIASVGGQTLRVTSLQRDMRAEIPGYGTARLNAAYAYGGPELVVRCVNSLFETNISGYVVVDYLALVRMVDALGGIKIDITQQEMAEINTNVWAARNVFAPLGYRWAELKTYGENVTLNGMQALGYARIRKTDSDFVRTSRQRRVIAAMLARLREDPLRVAPFIVETAGAIKTNLSIPALVSLGEKAFAATDLRTLRLPADGTFQDDGSSLTVTDWGGNVRALRAFLYGG